MYMFSKYYIIYYILYIMHGLQVWVGVSFIFVKSPLVYTHCAFPQQERTSTEPALRFVTSCMQSECEC